jgi:hypothetical protein
MPNIPRAYALSDSGSGPRLVSFDPLNPTVAASTTFITGLIAGQTLVGIDFRPANGLLYGLGVDAVTDTATLYVISVQTGAATAVGPPVNFGVPVDLPSSGYGFDFNPTVDRIRVTTDTGLNFRLNPNNGALAGLDTTILASFDITGAAYTNNHPSLTVGGPTTLYVLDSAGDFLNIQSNPNGGVQMPVGPTGVDFTLVNGFDIPAGVNAPASNVGVTGPGFALLTVGGITGFYSINLLTGAATLIGTFLNGATQASGLSLQLDFTGINRDDFNGDARADIFWTTGGGKLALWEMNGFQIKDADFTRLNGSAVGLPGPDWHVIDTIDTSGDGKTDVLWRTDAGKLAVWLMNGNDIIGADFLKIGSTVINTPAPDWHAVGTLDANGDAKGDILWRTDSGALAIWELNGNQIIFADYVKAGATQVGVPAADWHIVGDGDFDGDGKGGLLWRTDAGALATWELDGNQIKSAAYLQAGATTIGAPGADWHVVDVADFNGDGRSDILWRTGPATSPGGLEPGGGSVAIWLMNGNQIIGADYTRLGPTIVRAPGTDWHLLGADDHNGDGKADLLWRTDSGALAEWQMDGTQVVAADYTRIGPTAVGVPAPDWHVFEHQWDLI